MVSTFKILIPTYIRKNVSKSLLTCPNLSNHVGSTHVILTCLIKCIYICDESVQRFPLWQHVYHICLNIHVHLIFCHPCKQIMLKIVDLSWRWYGSKVCSGVKGQGVASTKVEFTEEEVLKFDDEKRNIKWITVSSKFCVPFFSELKFLFWSFQFFFT